MQSYHRNSGKKSKKRKRWQPDDGSISYQLFKMKHTSHISKKKYGNFLKTQFKIYFLLKIYFEQDDVLESNLDHKYLQLVDYQDFVMLVYQQHVLYD
jgi:hypothetical protein